MPRFFIEPRDVIVGEKIVLVGGDARHISYSLRARVGDEYVLCDTCNYEYICKITRITHDEVELELIDKVICNVEADVKITLYQALIKGDKFDDVVQKAVETGVYEIVPVISERCVSKPEAKQLEKKIERWNKISKAAAMQSGRSYIPIVREALSYEKALDEIKLSDCGFVCYETEPHEPMKQIFGKCSLNSKAKTYSFFVGPEGGISKREYELALSKGISLASLGKRILRTETAPICVISSIMFFSDNLG